MTILVTGGAGYIGSHTCAELLEAGYDVVAVDNLCNSSPLSMEAVKKLTHKELKFYQGDVCSFETMDAIFKENPIDCVIHFAGLKAVGESIQIPLTYYQNNLNATITLCQVMARNHVKKIVFSSSATVYTPCGKTFYKETFPCGNCSSPYGWTKFTCEQILRDVLKTDPQWSVVMLRYFNPTGAHPSGLIGEQPKGVPNNLMPYLTQTLVGKREYLSVFGNDYDTPDGTCVRDYIHVVDLAKGHLAALNYLADHKGEAVFNLGTGVGYSVLEIIHTFEEVNKVTIPYKITPRRYGDIAIQCADPGKSEKVLGWKAQYNLADMVAHSWNWQKNHPNGFETVR